MSSEEELGDDGYVDLDEMFQIGDEEFDAEVKEVAETLALATELTFLRLRAGVSREEMAEVLGVETLDIDVIEKSSLSEMPLECLASYIKLCSDRLFLRVCKGKDG